MFACYPIELKLKDRMIPLEGCKLFEEEKDAKWFCVCNWGYTYTQIRG